MAVMASSSKSRDRGLGLEALSAQSPQTCPSILAHHANPFHVDQKKERQAS